MFSCFEFALSACSNDVWPEAKFAALGAFIFLRYVRIDNIQHRARF